MRYIFILCLIAALALARAGEKAASPDFSSYPQTESFRHYLSVQTNATWHFQRTNILAVSSFPDGGHFALEYSVTESGREDDWRNVYDWAIQASHSKQLTEADLKSLRLAIRELPSESAMPPIQRLVIVSFRDGTNWVTRTYDTGALPKSMRQIYDIIGERFESKPRE